MGLRNRRTAPLGAVPVESVDGFRRTVAEAVGHGKRLISLFGLPEDGDRLRLIAILADDAAALLGATSVLVGERYPALTPDCPQAARFERELAEQCGVVPEGHPALKPVRRHPADQLPARWTRTPVDREAYRFDAIHGEEVHQVAVGPVHAGIIEPGHFRFQAHGESVLSLEIMLGYQHRGVEHLLQTADRTRAALVAESIAGDAVVGHADAHCGALEALARCRKTPRAQTIRGIALELERLANHLGDLGGMAGDVAYLPAAADFGALRGECLNLLMSLSGNRYGRGLLRPGGVLFDLDRGMAAAFRERLACLAQRVEPVARDFLSNASVQGRLEGVGVVPRALCREMGFVGPVARACEIARDVRQDHPWGVFRFAHIPASTAWAGDVFARAYVRWLEVRRSLPFLLEQLAAVPKGATMAAMGDLRPKELSVALAEGWRGEIVHAVVTDDRGRIRRYKVTDPSFHNWDALAAAMPGNQISDFPLCNKSFNLSYAGHDL
ncbi:MAG: NADH-quinone oxidoreductase subunit C [Gemmatimonadetes bacterium]|nr:NADH-quinone oxidoreductase subunit C [Gemmatimonadota bacterium]